MGCQIYRSLQPPAMRMGPAPLLSTGSQRVTSWETPSSHRSQHAQLYKPNPQEHPGKECLAAEKPGVNGKSYFSHHGVFIFGTFIQTLVLFWWTPMGMALGGASSPWWSAGHGIA